MCRIAELLQLMVEMVESSVCACAWVCVITGSNQEVLLTLFFHILVIEISSQNDMACTVHMAYRLYPIQRNGPTSDRFRGSDRDIPFKLSISLKESRFYFRPTRPYAFYLPEISWSK